MLSDNIWIQKELLKYEKNHTVYADDTVPLLWSPNICILKYDASFCIPMTSLWMFQALKSKFQGKLSDHPMPFLVQQTSWGKPAHLEWWVIPHIALVVCHPTLWQISMMLQHCHMLPADINSPFCYDHVPPVFWSHGTVPKFVNIS